MEQKLEVRMKSGALVVSLLPLGEGLGKRVGERNPFLRFVLRGGRVAFKDKNYEPGEAAVSPLPNPLPKGEGVKSASFGNEGN